MFLRRDLGPVATGQRLTHVSLSRCPVLARLHQSPAQSPRFRLMLILARGLLHRIDTRRVDPFPQDTPRLVARRGVQLRAQFLNAR